MGARAGVDSELDHRRERRNLRGEAGGVRRGRSQVRPRLRVPVPHGAERPPRRLRAGGRRRREARRRTGGRVRPQGEDDRQGAGPRAHGPRFPADASALPRTARVAPCTALLDRDPPSRPARLEPHAGRARAVLPVLSRAPARRARPRRCGEGAAAAPWGAARLLLLRRDEGDGGGARPLPAVRDSADVGEGEGHAVNRAVDVALAGVGLVLTSPVLAAAALAAKLEDRGPVLYRQVRVGKDGVDFEVLKLRTMVVGAEGIGPGYAVDKGDRRITRTGRILRRTSIDELPQLWNVLRGDMSMIGPRPTLRYQVEQYDEHQRHRLDIRPGLTGWAQVHGRAELPWAERIELDLWYVENRSPRLDLEILLRTPLALFRGTYRGATGGWRERA